jgi:hypothetical protein
MSSLSEATNLEMQPAYRSISGGKQAEYDKNMKEFERVGYV